MPDIDFSTATAEQLAAVTPAEFMQIVKSASDKEIATLMASDNRGAIIGAIFGRMPQLFRAEKAESLNATTHWRLTGRPDGGADEWTVRFADGACTTTPGLEGDSSLLLAMSPGDFVKVITRKGNPVMMFMTGKIKAKGDLGLAANLGSLFDIPRG